MAKYFLLVFVMFVTQSQCAKGQIITTFAGNGCMGPDSGYNAPAISACIGYPTSGSFDTAGNYYFAQDYGTCRVMKVNTAGIISVVAGNGLSGFSGDGGPATSAKIYYPMAVADAAGNIYVADRDNHRVRKVDVTTGFINTIAGNGLWGYSTDGIPATAATLRPEGVTTDLYGNVYVIDSGTRVRKISSSGFITTCAGNGIGGWSGDGGPATAASIGASAICTDLAGNLFIGGGGVVRKVNMSTGIISSVAGNGTVAPYTGDGPATSSQFLSFGIAVDPFGNIFIADYGVGNNRILKLDTGGMVQSIAGNGTHTYSGDGGLATAAQFDPEGVAIDACGNVYIADDGNRRIRKITYRTTPTISISSVTSAVKSSTVTVTASVASSSGSSYIIHWMNRGIEFAATTTPSVTYTKGAGIDTITARVVSTFYACQDSTTSIGIVINVNTAGVKSLNRGLETPDVYPNPAGAILHIDDVTAPSRYRLLNIVGMVSEAGTLEVGKNSIVIKELPHGIYMLEVSDLVTGCKMASKVVKQ